ncbi:MAG: TolC family protein [Roseivirga sp.]
MMIYRRTIYLSLLILFTGFGALGQNTKQSWTLEECINYAWENNLTIRTNQLNQLQNEISLKESRFSRLPNLNGNGSVGKQFGRTINPNTNEFTNVDVLGGSVSLNSSVTLYRGGQILNTIKQNEVNVKASEQDLQKAKNDIGLTVATNFLTVLLNQEQLENAKFQLRTSEEQLERTKKLVNAGSLPLANQLDLESQKATNEVTLINAENAVNLSMLTLKQSMQMPAGEALSISAPDIEVTSLSMAPQNPTEIYQIALNNQPDIKSAELGIESSDYGIKLAKAAFYPTVSLNGSISSNFSDAAQSITGFQNVAVPAQQIGTVDGTNTPVFSLPGTREIPIASDTQFFDQIDNNLGQSIGLGLNVPIFTRFSNKSNLQRAQITKQRAEITALNAKNTLRQNIESAYNNALASFKSYEATEKRVAALQESFRATEQQYNVGSANAVDYQVASNNLFAARTDLVRAKYEYIFRTKILDFYLGNPITLK